MIKSLIRTPVKKIKGVATDKFLELLLHGMNGMFRLSKILRRDFHKNIKGFKARYVFRTTSGDVGATADFRNGGMDVKSRAEAHGWNVRVTFSDPGALRDFLLSRDQDILNSLLKNEVMVEGNVNYIYKFGFMARDLMQRLHLA